MLSPPPFFFCIQQDLYIVNIHAYILRLSICLEFKHCDDLREGRKAVWQLLRVRHIDSCG